MRFHEVPEHDFGALPEPVFAIVIARARAGVVLVLNAERKVWELPGGFIDPGESPRQAAIRELAEEAGCQARDARWLGLVEVNDGHARFGGLLYCAVDLPAAGFASNETLAVELWREDRAPAPLGATDEWLLRKFAGS